MIGVNVWWAYLAPQNIPSAIVSALGNKIILYCSGVEKMLDYYWLLMWCNYCFYGPVWEQICLMTRSRVLYFALQTKLYRHVIIIIRYIYHALINAVSAHMIHINLNVIFYTHVERRTTPSATQAASASCPNCPSLNQHTRELINARKTSHKHNNKVPSRLR